MDDWDSYFAAVERFLVDSECQYGVCNCQYTNYAMEQLEFIEVTCRTLITVISQIFPGALCDLLLQLLTCVTILRSQWQSYSDSIIVLHGNIRCVTYWNAWKASI